jgi:cytochrome P450
MDASNLPPLPSTRTCPFAAPPPGVQAAARRATHHPGAHASGDVAWLVTRFEDIRTILTDRRFSSDPRQPGYPSYVTGNVPPMV